MKDLPLDRICNNIERSVNKLLLCDSLLERDIEWGHTVRVLPNPSVEVVQSEAQHSVKTSLSNWKRNCKQ